MFYGVHIGTVRGPGHHWDVVVLYPSPCHVSRVLGVIILLENGVCQGEGEGVEGRDVSSFVDFDKFHCRERALHPNEATRTLGSDHSPHEQMPTTSLNPFLSIPRVQCSTLPSPTVLGSIRSKEAKF